MMLLSILLSILASATSNILEDLDIQVDLEQIPMISEFDKPESFTLHPDAKLTTVSIKFSIIEVRLVSCFLE